MVLVYVDDLLITGNNPQLLCDTRKDLQRKFKIKDVGELKFFLGIEYAAKAFTNKDQIIQDPSSYQRLMGRLLYLTMNRPNLSFTVQVLGQYMHCSKISHTEAALRVVRYVKEAPGLGLLMPAENTTKLLAYCDSDWGACLETKRSVTGYLVKFGRALVS
ncbi:uncharacterized mitochondrial protein AtMg00810-like [Lycium barbarum]|uniref:uncharacterized mitochondrial protein AtMg00810-like n=1 Tax=Lycium barbarum TaxID=112863 RepID=UPI00293E1973|nr:uncharacterized mitochondrial protein AtMg00810-like [Lycium barbarum]